MKDSPQPWRLDGHRILVTGASRGIGFAIASECLDLGADVALIGRDQRNLEAAATSLARQHPERQVRALAADLGYAESINRVAPWIADDWPALSGLVNNVGTNLRKPALDYLPDEYHRIFETNLLGAFELSRQLHPLLQASEGASLVNVASVAGLRHIGTGAPYAMSKAAMIQMTKSLACEWGSDGIRVNTVAPWYIATDLVKPVLDDPDYMQRVVGQTPLGRVGSPAEAARSVVMLLLPAASYISGQCVAVDGGFDAFGFSGALG